MPEISIEERIAILEQEVARLNTQVKLSENLRHSWLDRIYGAFENEPAFLEAMELGRKYRESLRPKPRMRKKSRKSS